MHGIVIRSAKVADAPQIAGLIRLLGHAVDDEGVAARLASLEAAGFPQIVAVKDQQPVGLCGTSSMQVVHRDRPVGRITILVVRADWRGRGIGRALLETAEGLLRDSGCSLIEVTSNERLPQAHQFYERAGYTLTSKRYAKAVD